MPLTHATPEPNQHREDASRARKKAHRAAQRAKARMEREYPHLAARGGGAA